MLYESHRGHRRSKGEVCPRKARTPRPSSVFWGPSPRTPAGAAPRTPFGSSLRSILPLEPLRFLASHGPVVWRPLWKFLGRPRKQGVSASLGEGGTPWWFGGGVLGGCFGYGLADCG